MSFDILAAMRAPFWKALQGKDPDLAPGMAYAWSSGFKAKERTNVNDGSVFEVIGGDGSNNLTVGDSLYTPQRGQVTFNLEPQAQQATQSFWISDDYYYLTGIQYTHHVACTTAGTVTGSVYIDRGVGAPGSGSSVQTGSFDLKATADTTQVGVLAATHQIDDIALAKSPSSGTPSVIVITPGDRLTFVTSTQTLTSLRGVCLTLSFAPWGKSNFYAYYVNANAKLVTQYFADIDRPGLTVTGVKYYYKTKGSDAGAVTFDITQDAAGAASGAGTTILSAVQSLKQTAGTTYSATLTATAANLILTPGKRLSVLFAGNLAAVAGLVIVVYYTPTVTILQQFSEAANADLGVDQAWGGPYDREMVIEDCSCAYSTAAGGALKLAVTIDGPTQAPGAGTVVQTDNSSTGFDLNTTTDTQQVATMAGYRNRVIPVGYRLGMHYSTTKQSLAGLVLGATLRPVVK